jgi:hypothetical protein
MKRPKAKPVRCDCGCGLVREPATPPPPADHFGALTDMIPTPAISGQTAEEIERRARVILGGCVFGDKCICDYRGAAAILRELAALKRAGVLK